MSLTDDLDKFVVEQGKWADATFGGAGRGITGTLTKLKQEVDEILAAPDDRLEWADALMLLLDAARRQGMMPSDLLVACREKQAINFSRAWEKGPDGLWRHCG